LKFGPLRKKNLQKSPIYPPPLIKDKWFWVSKASFKKPVLKVVPFFKKSAAEKNGDETN
jgi:hypothetical protein